MEKLTTKDTMVHKSADHTGKRPLSCSLCIDFSTRSRWHLVIHKSNRFFQHLLHQLRRGGLSVDAHERLSAGGAQQDPGFSAAVLDGRIKKELDAVEVLFAQNFVASQQGRVFRGSTRDGCVFYVIGNSQIAARIEMRAVLRLKRRDKLAQALALVGHYIGEQESVEQAVALGQMALEADAAGLFAADQDLPLQHEVADVLEADAALQQLASMLGGDAVKHARGVKGAHHVARPVIVVFEHPLQQDGEDLM